MIVPKPTLTDWTNADMLTPFDPRTILLAKHAQHVVLIHFPIALFITGVGLDLLSRGKRDSQLASAAYLNLSIAAATVLPAVLTGLMAWQFALEGKRLKGLLLLHVIAASIATLLVITSSWIHRRSPKSAALLLPGFRGPVEPPGAPAMPRSGH